MTFTPETPTKSPPFFRSLRENNWEPRFHWENSTAAAADAINLPHEDYPHRIDDTEKAILAVMERQRLADDTLTITQDLIRDIHAMIFPDHGTRAGHWRQVNVRVADHTAPRWDFVPNMMEELERHYSKLPLDLETLRQWYYDFETIHPYIDGNGRTGGVILAAFSYSKCHKHLSPDQ